MIRLSAGPLKQGSAGVIRPSRIIKDYEESGALSARVSITAVIDEHTFPSPVPRNTSARVCKRRRCCRKADFSGEMATVLCGTQFLPFMKQRRTNETAE